MVKKGKKHSRTQSRAASTSSTNPIPSTSRQQSSQQQQQQSSRQQPQEQPQSQQRPQQQQHLQPQQPSVPRRPQQPQASQPQQPQASRPQQPQAARPQQPQASRPQQPQASRPQQPQAWNLRSTVNHLFPRASDSCMSQHTSLQNPPLQKIQNARMQYPPYRQSRGLVSQNAPPSETTPQAGYVKHSNKFKPPRKQAWASNPSTSTQQVVGTDDSRQMQTVQTTQDIDKSPTSESPEYLQEFSSRETTHKQGTSEKDLDIPRKQQHKEQQYTSKRPEEVVLQAKANALSSQLMQQAIPQTECVESQECIRQQAPQQQISVLHPLTSSQSSQQVEGADSQQMQTIQTIQDIGKSSTSELSEYSSRFSSSEAKQISKRDTNILQENETETTWTKTRVFTNMFEIIFNDNFVTTAVHYDVKIISVDNVMQQRRTLKRNKSQFKPAVKNKALLRKIFDKWREENYPDRHPAYDGKANAFAAYAFPFEDTWVGNVNIRVNDWDKDRTFEIIINKAGIVDLSWLKKMDFNFAEVDMNQTAVQVLDIILRHAPASKLINIGRSLFLQETETTFKSGLELRVGGFMSAVIGWKPYLNVDVAHKAFVPSGNVVDIICNIIGVNKSIYNLYIKDDDAKRIGQVLSGMKVNYEIPHQPNTKRTYRINKLGPKANAKSFLLNKINYSVENYYTLFKKYKLRYPNFPCVWVGKKTKQVYLPAELCKVIPDQGFIKKLNESQANEMINYAAHNTNERKLRINNALNKIDVNNSLVMRNEFHLEVSCQMQEVDAKILASPILQYNDEKPTKVRKGVWCTKKFSRSVQLEENSWALINISKRFIGKETLVTFERLLQTEASNLGMTVGKIYSKHYQKFGPEAYELEKEFYDMKGFKLIIVILPDYTDAIYGIVKKISELRVGVLTQCIKSKNVMKPTSSKVQNILLKINSKLSGVNYTFTQNGMPFCLRDKKYMLVGADVSHPSPEAKKIPSIAAITASHDDTAFKYNVTIRLQQPRQEEIADLKEIMIKHIKFYVKEMKTVPQIIIFYRDGVSEGQIGMVLDKEIKSIKEACREYARERPEFNPQLTFVIVQKRHHIRIFPTRKEDSDDQNFNVKAGTIVDTEITHPSYIDFYLVSHASIQGTARPTKYRCIYNESNFTKEQLEELTYYLCHMYARCTRSVSYPAPTYYAHLAAYRGRMWIQQNVYTEADLQDKNKCKLEPVLDLPMLFI